MSWLGHVTLLSAMLAGNVVLIVISWLLHARAVRMVKKNEATWAAASHALRQLEDAMMRALLTFNPHSFRAVQDAVAHAVETMQEAARRYDGERP